MHEARWLVGSSGAVLLAIAVGIGCSSSSPQPEAPDAGIVDAGCHVEASLAVFASSDAAGAGCAACVQTNCQPAIVTCSSDCTCIDFFGCVADAGTIASGISPATQQAASACAGNSPGALLLDPGLNDLLQCFQGPCASVCSASGDGGAGDGAAGPTDDAAADAATDTDAATAVDAGVDDAGPADAAAGDAQLTDSAADAHADGG
jgi:hypothetical protein